MKTELHWQKIGFYPHHGICLPLSALRSRQSSGIGEFFDLFPLIDWCQELQLDCIQLLPLTDSGNDPSPYNPLSSCALDPIYLSLHALGIKGEDFKALTQAPRVDRLGVLQKKMGLLRTFFLETFSSLSKTDAYRQFLIENPWLESYGQFKAIRERLNKKSWLEWPSPHPAPERGEVDFYLFLQFHCFDQMAKVRAYAEGKKVFLQGDIPILISPDSVDVWKSPSLFQLDLVAGAPPDDYNQMGQKWGFPLFNWEAMRKEGFSWWKQRLQVAEKLFHLYRIDHVVGFFRIWGIPKEKKALEGSFFPPDPALWAPQGKDLLEMMIASTLMLPIAEDLGTIPKCVYPVLKELGICGTKVIRWQKEEGRFIPYNEYEPFSMTTVSTPDMEGLELWWKTHPQEAVLFANFKGWAYHPLLNSKERFELLQDAHHTASIFHINLLQEYLALFPELVWPRPEEERINVPGKLLATNWTYRFRPFLEEIVAHQGLREAFKKILTPEIMGPYADHR